MDTRETVTRDELWRIQERLEDLSATQALHSERIMRLESKTPDGSRSRSLWGSTSPFPLGSSHNDSTLNPAAEAFRNFDADPMISSLTLDPADDSRRAAASRANSVRFDESANNHYGSSRQSIELPTRTGSGLGGHALSERSLSHRSDGRPSATGFGRTNSFGLEQSRLLGSVYNSPRVSGNPPPGFFVLGPCPAIIRCWLTQSFSNSSLLYAAVCTGSSTSSVGYSLLSKLGLTGSITDDGECRTIRLPVYLTEAKIHSHAVMRSASPTPAIPTLMVKFTIDEQPTAESSIQIILGCDVLRSHSADVLFSQDKMMIFDDDRNQLSIPLCRPEDDSSYKDLCTVPRGRSLSVDPLPPPASPVGVIGRPERVNTNQSLASTGAPTSATTSEPGDGRTVEQNTEPSTRSSLDLGQSKPADDSKSTTESEKSSSTPMSKSGVWSNSWRSVSSNAINETNLKQATSSYAKPQSQRTMKILRPGKTMANATRTPSSSAATPNGTDSSLSKSGDVGKVGGQPDSTGEMKGSLPTPARTNPIGSGTAFGWLNTGPQPDPKGFARRSKLQRQEKLIFSSSPSPRADAPAVETGTANRPIWEWKGHSTEEIISRIDKLASHEPIIDSRYSIPEDIDTAEDSVGKDSFPPDDKVVVRRHFAHGQRPLPAQRPSRSGPEDIETVPDHIAKDRVLSDDKVALKRHLADKERPSPAQRRTLGPIKPKSSIRHLDFTELDTAAAEALTDADVEPTGRDSIVRTVPVVVPYHPPVRKTVGFGREASWGLKTPSWAEKDEASIQLRPAEGDAMSVNSKRIANPVLLICDVQEKFRNAIWEFEKVITTSQKMVKAAKILNIPIFVTTQNAARLGNTVEEVTSLLPENTAQPIDKTAFSMLVPALQDHLAKLSSSSSDKLSVFLVGIETHICVTQTTLDLLAGGHKVYVLADGVSSCNASERPIALNRLAREGAIVTTSESLLFELVGDAKDENFKAVAGLVKDTKETTKEVVELLCRL
ncbi:hypothetical protein H2200_006535 [Cladophialophora chaetospira]|uniref:Isochorismatase-like domain-containing protein n=1 Tax=Cladophialophora chaetospira TaxID=386627 RepID=A0AA38X8K1_9EURO|nr:hypothetical protein H2200_006535 [Cladophialophora chaetospira]